LRLLLSALPAAAWAGGRVVAVGGVGEPTLAQALRSARPGDTLELRADLQGEAAVIEQAGITLRGVGARRTLHAQGQSAEGKALLVVRASGVTLENLAFRGARVPSGNGAGIRFESGSLVVRGCSFFDNENGILTGFQSDMQLQVLDCEFGAAPRHAGLLHHLLYVGAIARFELSGSRFEQGWRGHLVKSRARENRVSFNWLHDGGLGEASYELELPEGGVAQVVGNIIGQSAGTDNPVIVSVGAEAQPSAVPTRVLLAHNTVVNQGPPEGRFVQFFADKLGPAARLLALNNVFAGPGSLGLAPEQDGGGNLRVELADLVDAARADFRLGPAATRRASALAALPEGALALRAQYHAPTGTTPLPKGAALPGALQR
jgi:hypothetical protein